MKEQSQKTKNDPTVKVTNIGRGWGIRVFHPNGTMFYMEGFATSQDEIGPTCRHILRWYDKMVGNSDYADRARHRAWEKARECDNEIDKNLRNKDMVVKHG